MIPFDTINAAAAAALSSLLPEWFPNGKRRGQEFLVGDLNGTAGESLSINTHTAKWSDFATGEKGGDPISLYAAKFRTDRKQAAIELGGKLGVYLNGSATVIDSWVSFSPPSDAPAPPVTRFDVTYAYRSVDGIALRYVGRKEATADKRKSFVPITWGTLNGKTGWHKRHPLVPRCLYGLDRLAAMPDRTVIVCEGEKAADAASTLLPDYPCVTWSAGTANVAANDWSVLAGRPVVIWPDNDAPGHKAATQLQAILRSIAARVEILRVDDLPDGADAADIRPDSPVAWLRERLTPKQPDPVAPELPPDAHIESDGHREGIVPLGHDRSVYFYYSLSGRQVVAIPTQQHTRNMLMSLASVPHYWQRSRHISEKGAILWDDATDWLMRSCRDVGIYNPERVRGRGAWLDNGRAVLHMGDRLLVDGRIEPLLLAGSTAIYSAALPLAIENGRPLSNADAHKICVISGKLRWQRPISGTLFAGWIVCAMVCGALRWRPSIYVTGSSGSGKSWLLENVLAPLVGPIALQVQSKTSEAGIRQTLNSDALPVIFDEFEREDAQAAARVQGVLDLMRQSSSESERKIIKGTQNQASARFFRIRSCFAFSSINVGTAHAADESRLSILALQPPADSNETSQSAFRALAEETAALVTPAYAAGLLARSVGLLAIIRENAETFAVAVSMRLGTRRLGDQIGTLLAGAYSLHSTRVISLDVALAYVDRQEWGDATTQDQQKDEDRLLSHLTSHRVRLSLGNGPAMDITIGRLIAAAFGGDERISADTANQELRDYGIRASPNHPFGIWVSTNHPAIAKAVAVTPWAGNWSRTLSRLPDAETCVKAMRFGIGHVGKATWLPLSTLDRDGD